MKFEGREHNALFIWGSQSLYNCGSCLARGSTGLKSKFHSFVTHPDAEDSSDTDTSRMDKKCYWALPPQKNWNWSRLLQSCRWTYSLHSGVCGVMSNRVELHFSEKRPFKATFYTPTLNPSQYVTIRSQPLWLHVYHAAFFVFLILIQSYIYICIHIQCVYVILV